MTTKAKITLALGVILAAQVSLMAGFFVGKFQNQTPAVVTFDPERSLTLFVLWSADRFDKTGFQDAIVTFQDRVSSEVAAYGQQNSVLVMRAGGLLTEISQPLEDVTSQIMEGVLDDKAF